MFRTPLVRRAAAGALLLTLSAAALAPLTAGADEIADKKAQAAAIAAKVDELNSQIEGFVEAANGARYELEQVNAKIASAETRLAAAQAEQTERRSELRAFAIDAYVRGDDGNVADLADATSPTNQDAARAYLTAAASDRHQAIDKLRSAEEDVQQSLGELQGAQAEAEAKKAQIDAKTNAAQGALAEQERVQAKVEGELSALVAQAQAARAAEQQRAAQARQQQQAAQSRPPSATAPKAPAGPAPGASGDVGAVLAEARAQLGKPYVWGGSGPDVFDCSGFTAWAWRVAGVYLPHYTGAQYAQTRHISLDELQPGDLVFYGSGLGHVALYLGGGTIIHAPNSRSVVRYDSLYYWNTSMVASRP